MNSPKLNDRQRHALDRLAEGWCLVGNYVVNPESNGRRHIREFVHARTIAFLIRHRYVQRVGRDVVPRYEISDMGREALKAEDEA